MAEETLAAEGASPVVAGDVDYSAINGAGTDAGSDKGNINPTSEPAPHNNSSQPSPRDLTPPEPSPLKLSPEAKLPDPILPDSTPPHATPIADLPPPPPIVDLPPPIINNQAPVGEASPPTNTSEPALTSSSSNSSTTSTNPAPTITTTAPPNEHPRSPTHKPLPPPPVPPHSPRAATVAVMDSDNKAPAHNTLNKSSEMGDGNNTAPGTPKLDRKGSLACIDPVEDKKKSKWNLLTWVNKQLKLKDTDNGGTGGKSSGREKVPRDRNFTQAQEKPEQPITTDRPEKPIEEQTDSEAHARKVIVVSTIEDFPEECQKWIKQSGIPKEKLEANFKILMNVLHFRSGKTPEMLNDPPRPVLPKSSRIRRGEELVTDAGEFKKLYKDMEELGKGGFGTVFHARSTKDKKKPVAIKRMEHKTKKQKLANFHEASILNFCNHPNIVRYMTCHEIKDELWVVMELMEGGTFEDAAKAWHFSESNIAYIARELLKGIAYMHSNNLAHRDLKSANIMMSVRGEVKIIDLGLCADLSVGFPTHMVGSPFWMPPEMIQCKPHNSAVDIWSFAISLLEIANQRPPMIESAVKAMFTVGTEGVKELFVDPSKWSDVFKDFLGTCLKVDAEERATAESLLSHPFIKLADTRANMENILRRIFLSNSLLNSGF